MTNEQSPLPPTPAAPAGGMHPAAVGDTPLGYLIQTDRPCARCGFNLFGQPVVREGHYGLISARCPECGQLAALQEYPALGRWADRWARLIAAAWVATLVAAMFLNFGPLMGFVMGSLETACSDLGDAIADQYAASLSAEDPSALPMLDTDRRMKIEASWWHANRDSILAARPSLRAWINWSVAWMWIPLSFIGFAGGACWSTCLLGTRRRFAIVPAMLPLLAAGVIGWTVHRQEASGTALVQASTLGIGALQNIVLGVMLGVVAFWVFMGVWLGRRVVRLVVRWSLPPRMRSSLAILWTRDGLPPPSGSCRIDG